MSGRAKGMLGLSRDAGASRAGKGQNAQADLTRLADLGIKLAVRPYGHARPTLHQKADNVVSLAFEPSLMIFHRSPVQTFLRAFGSACRNTTRFSG